MKNPKTRTGVPFKESSLPFNLTSFKADWLKQILPFLKSKKRIRSAKNTINFQREYIRKWERI